MSALLNLSNCKLRTKQYDDVISFASQVGHHLPLAAFRYVPHANAPASDSRGHRALCALLRAFARRCARSRRT